MVTKLDVFVWLHENLGSRKIIEIVKGLNQRKSSYDKIRKILEVLVEQKLLAKTKHGYEVILNKRNQKFFEMLKYCMKNGINYNELFDKSLAEYLSKAFLRKSFRTKDINLHPKIFSRISKTLEKYGFLIVLSRKPFQARIPFNTFLGDLLIYYRYKPMVAKTLKDEYFDEIKKELLKFNRLKSKNFRKYQETINSFQIKFIHHSLSIEGNPITLAQTIKLLKDKVTPENLSVESILEVQNYQKAFLQMLKNVNDESPLTKESILNYHYTAMQHKIEYAGKIRWDVVEIRGNPDFSVAEVSDIEPLLDKLIVKYNGFISKKHPVREVIDFASYLHNEFQHIHPFFDGNSRTTRLITFHFLQMNDIPIFDIPLGVLEEYVFSTKGSRKRDEKRLSQVLQEVILYNLKVINEKLGE